MRAVHAGLTRSPILAAADWTREQDDEWYELIDWSRVRLCLDVVCSRTLTRVHMYEGSTADGDGAELGFVRRYGQGGGWSIEPRVMHSRESQVVLGLRDASDEPLDEAAAAAHVLGLLAA